LEQAQMLGLTGWVRNLPDERVEVLACGDKESVLQLYEWLKQGPRRAKVTAVTYEELDYQDYGQFVIM
jgi:acylphosphatase